MEVEEDRVRLGRWRNIGYSNNEVELEWKAGSLRGCRLKERRYDLEKSS